MMVRGLIFHVVLSTIQVKKNKYPDCALELRDIVLKRFYTRDVIFCVIAENVLTPNVHKMELGNHILLAQEI